MITLARVSLDQCATVPENDESKCQYVFWQLLWKQIMMSWSRQLSAPSPLPSDLKN